MSKHSKRNRRRRQAGMGGGFAVVHRLPKRARTLPDAPSLTPVDEFRLRWIEHAQRTSVADAVRVFRRSRATVYRWLKRYLPGDLRSLRPRSCRPKRTRRQQWTAAPEQALLRLRTAFPRSGKAKLRHLLAAEAMAVSASTIGRILRSPRRRQLLREPQAVRVRQRRPIRPYATRAPKDTRQPTVSGALIQLDTMHLRPLPGVERRPVASRLTAIDVVSRWAVLGVRTIASAGTAASFLDERIARMPFPVQAIQVDGGSEFMADFERACQANGIALYVLPPRSPKLNGRVERLNGTARRECWECYDGDLDLPTVQQALHTWEIQYNAVRPHQALGYATPHEHLATLAVSHVSN